MNKSIGGALAVFAISLASANVLAQDIDYGYFEIGYTQTDLDAVGGEITGNGPRLEGSFSLRDHVHGFVAYEKTELDDFDVSGHSRIAGLGTHFNIFDSLGAYGRFGIVDADVSLAGTPASDDGYYVSGGVRYRPAEGFEIRGGFEHVDFDDAGSDTGAFAGADLYLSDISVLAFGLRDNDAGQSISVGLRFYFRQDENRRR